MPGGSPTPGVELVEASGVSLEFIERDRVSRRR